MERVVPSYDDSLESPQEFDLLEFLRSNEVSDEAEESLLLVNSLNVLAQNHSTSQ